MNRIIGAGKLVDGVFVIKAVDPATGKVFVYLLGGEKRGIRHVI